MKKIELLHTDGGMFKNTKRRTSLVVQWLRLRTSTAGDTGSIPGRETKILHAAQHGQKKKKKEYKERHSKQGEDIFEEYN